MPSPELIGLVSTAGADGSALDELAMLDWIALSAIDELSEGGKITLLGVMSVVLNTLSVVDGFSAVLSTLSMVDSTAVLDTNSGDEGPASGVVDSVSVRKLLLLNCAGSGIIPSQYQPTIHSHQQSR